MGHTLGSSDAGEEARVSQNDLDNLVEVLVDLVRWQAEAENPPQAAETRYLN